MQAVLIASSTDTHVDLLTRSAKAGKAVLCEKPIDLDIAKVEACWAEIGRLDPVVMVGFNRRFDPSFKALRDRVQAGEIGRLKQVIHHQPRSRARFDRVSQGLGRHLSRYDHPRLRPRALPRRRHRRGSAMGANLIDPGIQAVGDVDTAMVTLRARDGALVHINNSRRCAYGYDQRVEAFGAEGMLQALNRHPTTVTAWSAERTAAGDPVLDFFIERYREAYDAEIDHSVDCVARGTKPLAGFAAGREALRLANAALESLRTGSVVYIIH